VGDTFAGSDIGGGDSSICKILTVELRGRFGTKFTHQVTLFVNLNGNLQELQFTKEPVNCISAIHA
jgi:hypothetical protein